MIVSVSALNAQLKALVESTFVQVQVQGEISNLTLHTSGHMYFSLKDADSQVRCVMFRGNVSALKFEPKEGMSVVVSGAVSVYAPRGEYQIQCRGMIPEGIGELTLRFQQLRQKLQDKGYFHSKKPLPAYPKRIAVLTSLSGAALQDMLKVARKRWNLTKIVAINTLVQGKEAKDSIARNIAYADGLFGTPQGFDVIVIGRGGGSIEDLWAFNEEVVAEAIHRARTPIVSAVGHEVDTVISDLVADLRAPTPSAAMEMILPDSQEWLMRLDDMRAVCEGAFVAMRARKQEILEHLYELIQTRSVRARIKARSEQLELLRHSLHNAMSLILQDKELRLSVLRDALTFGAFVDNKQKLIQSLQYALNALNPKHTKKGVAQVLKDGAVVELESVRSGEVVELVDTTASRRAEIL
ncbi:exodeoxyribonuclease VII large subunit [uncultured Helicobacter sp.]|uniref:exodeoxyribonuclease VII large subunit n=1 Tax=uncultured Helicobacter sp. TaxID=175537 RepID=UPI0037522996